MITKEVLVGMMVSEMTVRRSDVICVDVVLVAVDTVAEAVIEEIFPVYIHNFQLYS